MFWSRVTLGTQKNTLTFEQFLASVSALPLAQLWRHNQAGDLPGDGAVIDREQLRALVAANAGRFGFTYTHKPVLAAQSEHAADNREAIREANENGFTINLSGNNVGHADELAALGIAPVVTVLPEEYGRRAKGKVWLETLEAYRERTADLPKVTSAGRKVAVCPATYLDTNCKNCGLCQRQDRKVIVGFPVHGSGKKRAEAIARGA
jgi:hypothetical protein